MTDRKTRLTKSYAPIKNGLTILLDDVKPDPVPLKRYDKRSGKMLTVDNFYTKQNKQDIDPRFLSVRDFRGYTTDDWNEACANQRRGLKFKTNAELEFANLEQFLKDNENA